MPVTLPTALTVPPTLILPAVMILPPVTLPVALILLTAEILPPVTLPVADTTPLVRKLPACTLAVTAKLPSVPTVVKLDVVTLELRVDPVIKAAAGDDKTPVNCDPLPIKNCPAMTLATAETLPLPVKTPVTVAPAEVTVTTLATFDALINMEPLVKMVILLVPLEIPETPPAANN